MLSLLLALACAPAPASGPNAPNILIVLLDDVGVDKIGAYGEHPLAGPTPNLDALAAQGMLFRNAYTNPVCSPTRAQLLTGRHAFRTGIGKICRPDDFTYSLPLSETTIPEALCGGWAVGKWHLADGSGPTDHPLLSGFDHWRGHLNNFGLLEDDSDYFRWIRWVDGDLTVTDTYATTRQVDDALELIAAEEGPWFGYLAMHAPHAPWHVPPRGLYTVPLSGTPSANVPAHHRAILEAADMELGRLFAAIDLEETYVFVLGDNGTPDAAALPPFGGAGRSKGSPYEGGVNVPLIVAGPGIAAGVESAALVQSTDIFATVCALRGVASAAEDSLSFAPVLLGTGSCARTFAYAERFQPNGVGIPHDLHYRMARDVAGYKIVERDGVQEFYHLPSDPFEGSPLLPPYTPEQKAARTALLRELDVLR